MLWGVRLRTLEDRCQKMGVSLLEFQSTHQVRSVSQAPFGMLKTGVLPFLLGGLTLSMVKDAVDGCS